MDNKWHNFLITPSETILNALEKIDENRKGFVVVIDSQRGLLGTLTDGDIRRAFIRGYTTANKVELVYTRSCKSLTVVSRLTDAIDMFKQSGIDFLPIVDDKRRVVNILTKGQLRTMLLLDVHIDLTYDFFAVDENVMDYEIHQKPWGFYKTTVLTDHFQSKLISVQPGESLSLQSHEHREEHWIVVHGDGTVYIDKSVLNVHCGSYVFIPKGAKHRLTNLSDSENLIVTEVQIGNYFGEDDIIRYEDIYGRTGGSEIR